VEKSVENVDCGDGTNWGKPGKQLGRNELDGVEKAVENVDNSL
jgi:hypothetical protein